MAQDHQRERPDSACSGQEKPAESKPCKVAVCGAGGADDGYTTSAPLIEVDRGNYKQQKDDSEVQLTVGGTAIILVGTSKVRIRCPVRKFDRYVL